MSAIVLAVATVVTIAVLLILSPETSWVPEEKQERHGFRIVSGIIVAVLSLFAAYSAGRWL